MSDLKLRKNSKAGLNAGTRDTGPASERNAAATPPLVHAERCLDPVRSAAQPIIEETTRSSSAPGVDTPSQAGSPPLENEMPPSPVPAPVPVPAPAPADDSVMMQPGKHSESDQTRRLQIDVEVVHGYISLVPAQVALVGHYYGSDIAASGIEFDSKLTHLTGKSLITRLIELGIVCPELGEIHYVPLQGVLGQTLPGLKTGVRVRLEPQELFVAGFGHADTLTKEDVSFVMTNLMFVLKSLGKTEFSTYLIGTKRDQMSPFRSVRAILEGHFIGMDRFHVDRLTLKIVCPDLAQWTKIRSLLRNMQGEKTRELIKADFINCTPRLTLMDDRSVQANDSRYCDDESEKLWRHEAQGSDNPRISDNSTRITVTSVTNQADKNVAGQTQTSVFQYSALSESAVIPTRDIPVQNYFASRLPNYLRSQAAKQDQWDYGHLMTNYFVPTDIQKLIESDDDTDSNVKALTLILDQTTAAIPWEMAAYHNQRGNHQTDPEAAEYQQSSFYGLDYQLARQFRSSLGETVSHVPELTHRMRVLIIADPMDNLPEAKAEGLEIAKLLLKAQKQFNETQKRVEIWVHLRIGRSGCKPGTQDQKFHDARHELGPEFQRLSVTNPAEYTVKPCDPMEILKLLLVREFDIIHYSGHACFDSRTDRKGWVFGEDCVLSASEIFRARRVPRLVFANACKSTVVSDAPFLGGNRVDAASNSRPPEAGCEAEEHNHLVGQVGLAEAFFSRGVQNYIGAGWPVDDGIAKDFALAFYEKLLGIDDQEPSTIGAAMLQARESIYQQTFRAAAQPCEPRNLNGSPVSDSSPSENQENRSATWAAYQHYGLLNARLIVPLKPNDTGLLASQA